MFSLFKKKRNATLVLGGGSARGIAHIGVLKVLEKEKVPINRIVGTSMGALVGAAYSLGVSLQTMEDKARKFSMNRLLDPTMPKMGILAGDKLEAVIRELIDEKGFRDCRIPIAVVTTDIENGEEVVYQEGDLLRIVRASCSWPGVFNPVRIGNRLLCDGGIKNSVPTKIAKALGPNYIIAVDVGFCVKRGKIENILQMIMQSFQITGEELNKYQAQEADVVIKVEMPSIDQAAFDKAQEIVKKGVEAAESKIGEIKKDLTLGGFEFY